VLGGPEYGAGTLRAAGELTVFLDAFWEDQGHYTGRLADLTTDLVQFDYRQCRHDYVSKDGFIRGKQRLECSLCKLSFTANSRADHFTRIRVLAPFYKARASMNRASIETGYDYASVRRYYRLFENFEAERA
jgi:hypothetical protein